MAKPALTVYARIEGKKIIEYPVYDYHIANRHHPVDWYTPCVYDAKPETDAFHYAEEVKTVSLDEKTVEVRYVVTPYSLDVLLSRLPRSDEDRVRQLPGMEQPEPPPPTPELLLRIQKLIAIRVQENLDAFVQTREYDTIGSACSYATSTNARFAAEGKYCVELRDTTWDTLYAKLSEIQAGTLALPTRYSTINAWLPVPAWPA